MRYWQDHSGWAPMSAWMMEDLAEAGKLIQDELTRRLYFGIGSRGATYVRGPDTIQ